MNFVVNNGKVAFFHHAVDCTGKTKDAPFIADKVNEAIANIGNLTGDESRACVVCIVTDNASDMTTAWDAVRDKNPHLICLGYMHMHMHTSMRACMHAMNSDEH